ncbi:uncharacterized protein FMAN_15396 [Fusarium mangiferae]|uniref:PNPLA domain-containing protein n=1 Tax=Fusarium mangiferae TaxID=192010 RepID=A0A1L7U9E0_FUSMA|nr:uncharacterized protein FMAN_15396 [Fusarium mangiferae]CVL07330.1 uncharacterized protein FMAN_15396 [Fusarium mangiferae]
MPGHDIRLLALDGGGVRGLSSLMILQNLMSTIDPDAPPKPCDYFDMIAGTSTGGLIAIMLGRLRMTVDECIAAYTSLSNKVFEKKSHRVKINGQLQGSLVCVTSKETGDTMCLTSYRSARGVAHLYDSITIWQACRATSAATTFFDPIAIGPYQEQFVDGALGDNNPVYTLWTQAQDVWGDDQLRSRLRCLVSIGTGVPTLKPVRDDVLGIRATLTSLATETEKTAEQFRRDKSSLDDEGRYYRFNVSRGLEDIGLAESKKQREIAAATGRYVASQDVFGQMKACANGLARRQYFGPFKTPFSLDGVPASDKFVARPADTAELEKALLPQRSHARRTDRKIFVLFGLGGVGKTQLSIDFARRHQAAIAGCISKIPKDQVPETSRRWTDSRIHSQDELDDAVANVMKWLEQPDNCEWLLIFDNVDKDWIRQESGMGAYDPRRYLPGDHGSVLITTRLSRLAQLGESRRLGQVNTALGKAILEKWFGSELGADCDDLLELLHGLPLALAQAGSYIRETGVNAATYVRIYNEQWAELMGPCDTSNRPLLDYAQGSVRTTWTISFKEIERQSPNAAKLLRLWAFLDNRQLWHGLLAVTADGGELRGRWPDWLSEVGSSVVRFLDAVRMLFRYSMIEIEEGLKDSYSMHPVIHRWASCLDGQQQKKEWIKLALDVVGQSVPFQGVKEYWLLQQRLLPHAERCLWWIRKNGLSLNECSFRDAPMIDSLHCLGILFADRGKLQEAEEMYDQALKGHEATLGPDHTSTLKTVQNIGNLYKVQGKLREAEKMYDRALKGHEATLGPDHTSTLEIANNLGTVYADQSKLREAERTFSRALQIYETTPGPDSGNTLILDICNNLGCLYRIQGELQKAEMMYNRALEGYKNRLGHQHTWTLRTVNNLGVLYADQDMLQEAEEKYSQALQGYKTTLGTNHMSTLNVASNLGHVYSKQGKLQEAEEMYNQALAGYEKTLGRHHDSTVEIVEHLGYLHANQFRLRKAEEMYQRALGGYEKALERDHPKISQLRTNIKSLQHAQVDFTSLDEESKPAGRLKAFGKAKARFRRLIRSRTERPGARQEF